MTTPEGPKNRTTKHRTPCGKSALFKPFCSPLLQPQRTPRKIEDAITPDTVPKGNNENVEDELSEASGKPRASPKGNDKSKYHTPCRRVGLSRPKRKTIQSPFCSPLINKFCPQVLEDAKNMGGKSEEAPQEDFEKRKVYNECTTDKLNESATESETSREAISESLCPFYSPLGKNSRSPSIEISGGKKSEGAPQEDFRKRKACMNEAETLDESFSESTKSTIINSDIEEGSNVDQEAPKRPKLQVNAEITPGKSVRLSRFTTEEYLAEYEKDPVSFAKSLDQINDSEDDFVPLNKLKDKMKKKRTKEYMAIYCPVSKLSKKLSIVLERETLTTRSQDSDEEMFTSSPEDDKKQRQNLLDLINKLKEENTEKEKLLDRLHGCEIYKKKHDREKLTLCTKKWLNGCKIGLEALLPKMQELGPIEMGQLVKKLGIPDYIVNKLNLL